jgi:hypothetical protein
VPAAVLAQCTQFAWERTLSGGDIVDLQLGLAKSGEPPALPGPWWGPMAVLRRWRADALPGVPRLFLEVDATPGGPRPLLFPGVSAPDRLGWGLTAMALLDLLSDGACPAPVTGRVLAVLRALPPGGEGTYVAWMGARGHPHARFIGSVPRAGLAGFLRSVGWPGDAPGVAEEVDAFVPDSSHVQLGLDVLAEGVGPRLGAEVFWAHPIGGDPRMDRALDRLATWPEVEPDRVAAAAAWSRARSVDPSLEPRLQLKLCWDRGRRAAKAYLGCWNL